MRIEYLADLPKRGRARDSESYAIEPGLLAPPSVCWSEAFINGLEIDSGIVDATEGQAMFESDLDDPDRVVIGANYSFDVAVAAVRAAREGRDIMPGIRKMYEDGRVFDIQLAEALDAIAGGYLGKDPRTLPMRDLKPAPGKKKGSYSLMNCVDLVLGRTDAKENDEWRLRYGELDGIPIDQWPYTARQYPVDDAVNTLDVALAQTGHSEKCTPQHTWISVDGAPSVCSTCGKASFGGACRATRPHRNLHDMAEQARGALALHFAGVHGFKVDQMKVDIVETHAVMDREDGKAPFVEAGIIRLDGSEDQSRLKRLTAIAYGAKNPCYSCRGTGKVPSPSAKAVRCRTCKGKSLFCDDCGGEGKKVYTLIVCCEAEVTEAQGEEKRKVVKTKTCDGTGLVLTDDIPRTDTGGVGTGRDPLYESGDELLMAYAEYCEDDKVLVTYVPYLRSARRCVDCGAHGSSKSPHPEGCPQSGYYGIPLTLGYNSLVATGRVSCRGSIQLFPRSPGYIHDVTKKYIPSLRECIVPRCWNQVVEVDDGYVLQPGEEMLP